LFSLYADRLSFNVLGAASPHLLVAASAPALKTAPAIRALLDEIRDSGSY
jgi:hypothetical protein